MLLALTHGQTTALINPRVVAAAPAATIPIPAIADAARSLQRKMRVPRTRGRATCARMPRRTWPFDEIAISTCVAEAANRT